MLETFGDAACLAGKMLCNMGATLDCCSCLPLHPADDDIEIKSGSPHVAAVVLNAVRAVAAVAVVIARSVVVIGIVTV